MGDWRLVRHGLVDHESCAVDESVEDATLLEVMDFDVLCSYARAVLSTCLKKVGRPPVVAALGDGHMAESRIGRVYDLDVGEVGRVPAEPAFRGIEKE